jgi:hypothetical protein
MNVVKIEKRRIEILKIEMLVSLDVRMKYVLMKV